MYTCMYAYVCVYILYDRFVFIMLHYTVVLSTGLHYPYVHMHMHMYVHYTVVLSTGLHYPCALGITY